MAFKISNTGKFSGHEGEDWERWLTHFEVRFAELKEEDLVQILGEVLEGPAVDLYVKLQQEGCKDYKKTKQALDSRFGRFCDPLQACAELRRVRQHPGETAEAFGDRVLALTKQAAPDLPDKQIQRLALQQFLCGLTDHRLQGKLNDRDDIVTLELAVNAARKFKQKEEVLQSMRAPESEERVMTSRHQHPSREPEEAERHDIDTLKNLMGRVQADVSQLKLQLAAAQNNGQQRDVRRCFECGAHTHLRRNCPKVMQQQGRPQHPSRSITTGGTGCFHCGEQGHWKRQCPHLGATSAGATGSNERGQERNAFCLGCGAYGHWMAACSRLPMLENTRGHQGNENRRVLNYGEGPLSKGERGGATGSPHPGNE